ncbi:energy transducer TonB [Microbulbifer marinus]|uniref:Outer membrane transport energization protein TonB n=1 Tax=Microbulbifer marinus TaxID=658218 RepID=A0A1H3YED4_9GAMM|nr:energy transducer TonB [Microbulbifer marinus]SEA09969.1 outer membrane transport energization protein TonB [Microbulbifer marinus]
MDRAALLNSNPVVFSFHRLVHGARHLALAGGITLLLILAMSRLIAADFTEPVLEEYVPIKSIHLPELTVTVEKSEPPAKPQDPPPQPVTRVDDKVVDPVNTTVVFNPPLPRGDQVDAAVISRDPLPVFKPAPRYPSAALRRGMEGYVVVEFTITATGAVRNVRAVAGYDGVGNPTDIFNRSAEAAAARFKYQPQLDDGVPVERHGVRNRITYKLAQ